MGLDFYIIFVKKNKMKSERINELLKNLKSSYSSATLLRSFRFFQLVVNFHCVLYMPDGICSTTCITAKSQKKFALLVQKEDIFFNSRVLSNLISVSDIPPIKGISLPPPREEDSFSLPPGEDSFSPPPRGEDSFSLPPGEDSSSLEGQRESLPPPPLISLPM